MHSTAQGDYALGNEHELLAGARRFDPDALGRIHDEYYGPVFRYALYRTGERETAEDIASEVFTRLLEGLRAGTGPTTTLTGWLFGVAARVVNDHFRQAYRAPMAELSEVLPDHYDTPTSLTVAALEREELRQALEKLTEEQQHVIALRFGQGMPIQDVARMMGKSEGAVKQLQARAVATLARQMKRDAR
jgi:RNA polymerase sigma-70 factor (ECF subfamily)